VGSEVSPFFKALPALLAGEGRESLVSPLVRFVVLFVHGEVVAARDLAV